MNKVRLGEICTFQSGGTPSKSIDEYYHGTIPWITTVALNGNQIDGTNAVEWITDRAIAESAAKIVPVNSIMVGTRVGVGKVAINTVEMSTSQDVISLLNIDDSIWNKDYLCKFIQSKSAYLNAQARGATIKGIKIDVLSGLELPDISVLKQQRISRVLDTVSRLIEKHQTQIALLDELIKSRFVEMFGEPIENPMGWEVKTLNKISVLITNGNTPKGGSANYVDKGIVFLRSQNVWRNKIDLSDVAYIDEETHREMRRSIVKQKDILITKTGRINTENSSLGRAALWLGKDDSANLNGHVYLVRLNDTVVPEFVVTILTGEAYRKYIRKVCVGGIDKRQINLEQVEEFPIIIPPKELQIKFTEFAAKVEQQKTTVQKSVDHLETLKKSLMQEYFG